MNEWKSQAAGSRSKWIYLDYYSVKMRVSNAKNNWKIKTKTPNKHSMHGHNSIVIRYNDSSRSIPVSRSHLTNYRKQKPNTVIVHGLHTKIGFQSRGI